MKKKQIQTEQFSIHQENHWERRKTSLGTYEKRYKVRTSFVVTLSETSMLQDLIAKVLEAGATNVLSTDFQTSEFKKYREQARELALIAGKEKAEKMAAVLGRKVGSVISISENFNYGSRWRYFSSWYWWGAGNNQSNMMQNVVQSAPEGGASDNGGIPLGQIAIDASVSQIFELQ